MWMVVRVKFEGRVWILGSGGVSTDQRLRACACPCACPLLMAGSVPVPGQMTSSLSAAAWQESQALTPARVGVPAFAGYPTMALATAARRSDCAKSTSYPFLYDFRQRFGN